MASPSLRPAALPDSFSVIWPNRVLRKHDTRGPNAGQDKIITQSSLQQIRVSSKIYPLVLDNQVGGLPGDSEPQQATGKIVFCHSMSGSEALTLRQLLPAREQDQIECPASFAYVFFIDELSQNLCSFSNVSGDQSVLLSLKPYITKKSKSKEGRVIFTDL